MAIEVRDQDLCLTFPGGARVCAQVPMVGGPSPLVLSKQLMAQASAGLAPLGPIFDLIEFATSVKDFAEAVPGLLTDPSALFEATAALIENVDALIQLIPQLSVPILLLDLVDMLLSYLTGLTEVLDELVAQEAAIADVEELRESSGVAALTEAIDVAAACLDGQMGNLKAGAGPVDELIGLINTFVSLVPGVPEIPTLGDLGDDPAAGLATVEGIVAVLGVVRSAIPV